MTTPGLEILNRNVQITHEWINELDAMLGWNDKARSYRLLRVTLQTLRDCLPLAEIADFSAQMPTLLRGVFYEHWRPGAEKKRFNVEQFYARLDEAFSQDPIKDMGDVVAIVFDFLSAKISAGEISDVRHALPVSIREVWQHA